MEFLHFEQYDKSTTNYTILVTATISKIEASEKDRQLFFQIKDRYSGLLEFSNRMAKQMDIQSLGVEFPEKKTFGNTE